MATPFTTKIRRLNAGGVPRVLDLFSGCGGLSLGFKTAGFDIVGAVEHDKHAAQSHAVNFPLRGKSTCTEHVIARDITEQDPNDLIQELNSRLRSENAVDVIVGGPPCQAYARVGRAKLREVDAHPDAFLRDPRRNLYLRYLAYVRELKPLAILMENVPDVMNVGGHNVAEEVCEVLAELGYECRYTLLNAAFYGVPQMRERMFLLAYSNQLGVSVRFPAPTHWIDLPVGYNGSRNVALRVINHNGGARYRLAEDRGEHRFYESPPRADSDLPTAITTEEAIRDLPPIRAHLKGEMKRGVRRFDELVMYNEHVAPSSFARLMRSWPGFENAKGVYDHVIRSLPRDYAIFRIMEPGDQYPEAWRLAQTVLLPKAIRVEELRLGRNLTDSEREEVLRRVVPPYDPHKFPNKWRKLEAFLPSRTLMAHIGKDTYSHIHYDSDQARTISVREAARLQSFPDGFVFSGTMNPAFRQIGNAVPPLLALSIAEVMFRSLTNRTSPSIRWRKRHVRQTADLT